MVLRPRMGWGGLCALLPLLSGDTFSYFFSLGAGIVEAGSREGGRNTFLEKDLPTVKATVCHHIIPLGTTAGSSMRQPEATCVHCKEQGGSRFKVPFTPVCYYLPPALCGRFSTSHSFEGGIFCLLPVLLMPFLHAQKFGASSFFTSVQGTK